MFDLNDPMDTETCVYIGCGNRVEPGCCVCNNCQEVFDEWVRQDREEMERKREEAEYAGAYSQ